MIVDFGEVPSVSTSRGTTRIRFPNSKPPAKQNDSQLHNDSSSYGVVYANELAMAAYLSGTPKVFPVGSIIVREKLSHPASTDPQMLAVMIKKEKGFNPRGGDWSFLTLDGTASKVKERTKKGQCLECHESARDRDFVFELK
jgi:Cytochrome P460